MSESKKLSQMLAEFRSKGQLPVLDANVATICSLTGDPLVGAAELTSVILRDPALMANVISTANSALYHPAEPVKTVSAAILIMGFESVRSLALSLAILKQVGQTAHNRNLFRLFACSYFSGMFAMSLGQKAGRKNAEEMLVAGLLSQLPRLLLAHAFPERYAAMEQRMLVDKLTLERACHDAFGVSYIGLAGEIARFWNLPANLVRRADGEADADILEKASHLADMIFGNQPGGAETLAAAERGLRGMLKIADFKLGAFVETTCAADPNVHRFFHLGPKDVEMMVRIVEWGKVSPAEVAASLTFGPPEPATMERMAANPTVLIGHYLTELMTSVRRGTDVNRVLLTSLEAICRCVQSNAALLAFLDASKQRLQGRFFLGSTSNVRAMDYVVDLRDEGSPVTRSLRTQQTQQLSVRRDLPDPFLKSLNLDSAFLVPLVVGDNAIGQCIVGRVTDVPFSEQECMWIEAVAGVIASAFERTRAKTA